MYSDLLLFMKGAVIGFSVAAPLGPIGFLCLQRTLTNGTAHGFATGLGVAMADGVYGVTAALGLMALMDTLVGIGPALRLLGGLFILWIGWRILRNESMGSSEQNEKAGLVKAFASAFGLTLSNPMTILSFLAIFTSFNLVGESNTSALLVVAGVFFGSLGWWITLTILTTVFRGLVQDKLTWVNRVAGVVVICFGLAAVVGF